MFIGGNWIRPTGNTATRYRIRRILNRDAFVSRHLLPAEGECDFRLRRTHFALLSLSLAAVERSAGEMEKMQFFAAAAAPTDQRRATIICIPRQGSRGKTNGKSTGEMEKASAAITSSECTDEIFRRWAAAWLK